MVSQLYGIAGVKGSSKHVSNGYGSRLEGSPFSGIHVQRFAALVYLGFKRSILQTTFGESLAHRQTTRAAWVQDASGLHRLLSGACRARCQLRAVAGGSVFQGSEQRQHCR